MKIGLVGFAGSGKTTVFNAMTGLDAPVGFGGEVRVGTVKVPDERIGKLSAIYSPRKTTYAEMAFCDVPGEHSAEKKGLSRRSLQQIRDQEALCLVLRDFPNPALESDPDPLGDLERGFIRAEVIPYHVFLHHGSEQRVKDQGLLQVQGKDYIVSDADLMSVRFNV